MMRTIKHTMWLAWQQEESSKSKWYNSVKRKEGLENYLTSIHSASLRNCLSRFRLGAHWLEVETGRWQNKPREDCTCRACMETKGAQIEDEDHMVKVCLLYDEVRKEFADLDFDRSVQEIVLDSRVTLVARFLARCEAIRTRSILAV